MSLDALLNFLITHRLWVLVLTLAVVAIAAIAKWRLEFLFLVKRIWYRLPLIGRTSRLAKDSTANAFSDGWYSAERSLCDDFRYFVDAFKRDKDHFNKCHSYLDKTEELGRNKLSFIGWAILLALVVFEAIGFGFVLSKWMMPDMSEQMQTQVAIPIAFVLSAILVFLTHSTGHEIYKNYLAKKVRTWYEQYEGDNRRPLTPESFNLENDGGDDEHPRYSQLLNRVDFNATVSRTWWTTGITVFLILLIAVGTFYVRAQAIEESMQYSASQDIGMDFGGALDEEGGFGGVGAANEPVNEISTEPANEQVSPWDSPAFRGSIGTYIVLSIVFIALQVVGVLVGYKYGFVGQESADARKYMGKFNTASEYMKHWEQKRTKAKLISQKHLGKLQQKMLRQAKKNNAGLEDINRLKESARRTFHIYVAEKDKDETCNAS